MMEMDMNFKERSWNEGHFWPLLVGYLSRVFIVPFLLKNLCNNYSFFTLLPLIGTLAIFVYFGQHKRNC